jgi:hypothetical protein
MAALLIFDTFVTDFYNPIRGKSRGRERERERERDLLEM